MLHNFCIEHGVADPEMVDDAADLGMNAIFDALEQEGQNDDYAAGRRQQQRIVRQFFN